MDLASRIQPRTTGKKIDVGVEADAGAALPVAEGWKSPSTGGW